MGTLSQLFLKKNLYSIRNSCKKEEHKQGKLSDLKELHGRHHSVSAEIL